MNFYDVRPKYNAFSRGISTLQCNYDDSFLMKVLQLCAMQLQINSAISISTVLMYEICFKNYIKILLYQFLQQTFKFTKKIREFAFVLIQILEKILYSVNFKLV